MQNIFTKISFGKVKDNLIKSFKRFPIAFISIFLIFWLFEYLIFFQSDLADSSKIILTKAIISVIFTWLIAIWVNLFFEWKIYDFDKKKKYFTWINLIKFSPIILWILFFLNFEANLFNNFPSEELLYIFVSIFWAISFIFISKFIFSEENKWKNLLEKIFKSEKNFEEEERYFLFFWEKSLKIAFSWFLWLSLMFLWFIAIWSILELFDLSKFLNEGKIFSSWAAFSLSFFAPLYFLWIIWKHEEVEDFEIISENNFYNFFIKFLALPAIILYFVILYSYSAKVLLNFWDWPNWIISWLIIFFSLFAYIVYILSFVLEIKSVFVKTIRKIIPFAVLFQLPMFFYALFLRINQYDFTINRYLLLAFWFYLLAISAYFIFSKKRKIMYIFSFLFSFVLFISISLNYSVYKFPENRQLNLLEKNLIDAKILVDWKIILPEKEDDISKKNATEIYHKVDYLCEFHWCDVLWKFIPKVLEEIKKEDFDEWEKRRNENIERFSKAIEEHWDEVERTEINKRNLEKLQKEVYTWINSRDYKNKIIESLKVQNYYYADSKWAQFININLKNHFVDWFYDVRWWDYFARIYEEEGLDYYFKDLKEEDYKDIYYWKYTWTWELIIFKWKKELEKISLSSDFEKFYEENKDNVQDRWFIQIKRPFEIERDFKDLKVKVLLRSFSMENPEYSWEKWDVERRYLEWDVLIKEK